MIGVKKKSISTSSDSNEISACSRWRKSLFKLGMRTELSQREEYFYSIRYQAGTWKHDRRVCIRSVREANEVIFHHEFIITNLSDVIPAERVYQSYWKRGTMENFIKEARNGFFFDKTDSSHFLENGVRMMVSLLSYNINNFLYTLAFPEKAYR